MVDIGAEDTGGRAKPQGSQPARQGVAALLAVLAAVAAVAVAWLFRDTVPLPALAAGGLLAAVGLFGLTASIAGYLRFGRAPPQQAFFDGMADALGDCCVVTDARGRAVYANAPFLKLAGASGAKRLIGIENIYAGYPDIATRIYRLSQAAGDTRTAVEEFRLAPGSAAAGAKPGQPVWIRIRVSPIGDGSGRGYTLWRHQDISEDKAKQEQAFAHLQFIINYLDNAPAGFFSAEPSGKLAYINATLATWLGHDLDQLAQGEINIADIMPEASLKVLRAVLPQPGQATTETVDVDLTTKSGKRLPVRVLHRVDYDANGRVQPTRSLVMPGTAAKLAGQSSDADVRLARFLASAPIGIAELDAQGVILNANQAFLSLSPQVQRGATLGALVAPSGRQAIADAIKAAGTHEAEAHFAEVAIEGEVPRTLQLALTRLTDADETYVAYALDTTENKTLEVQLAQSQKMQAIGQLAGGVAHDFNNVLTAIIGFSDLLLARHRQTDPAFADIMNIKQNANRAANLVRQLLAFSRRQTLRPEVLLLTDVLSDLGNLLGRLLGEKIELKVVHERDLWHVKADINQFEQVIVNLAVNARDAMPNGGTLSVRTRKLSKEESKTINPGLMPPGEYVLCEVEDTGTGIPKEIREKIWEPFFSTKDVGKGTGLGLSTVYGIVKQTGGFIFCDSEMGRGTVFRIYLPRHEAKPVAADAPPKEEKREAKRADLTGRGTILLVEDEDTVRAFASRALASRGYTVLEANTGERGLEIMEAQAADIDLILSDVVMPEMDGPTLLKEIRKRGINTKVIFISGYAEDAFAKNLEGHTDFAFLPKPFSLKQLAEAVKDVMES